MGKKRRSRGHQRAAPRRESTTITDVPAAEGSENKRPRSDRTGAGDAPEKVKRRDDEREEKLAQNQPSRVDEGEAVTTTIDEKNGKHAKKRKKKHEMGKPRDDEDDDIGGGGLKDLGAATATKKASKRWWSDLPWRSVDEGEDHDKPWEDEDDGGYNHYDDPDADPDELFRDAAAAADGGMGMMFGSLEVVDGSLYEVKRGNGDLDDDDGAMGDKSPVAGKERVKRGSRHSLAEEAVRYGREEDDDEGEEVVSAEGSSTAKEQEGRRSEKEKDLKGRSESTIKENKGTKSEPTNEDAEAKPISERQQRRREKRRLAKREKKARKKRARREAEEAAAAAAEADPTTRENDPTRFTEEEVSRLGENWNASCNYGAPLHVTLCRGLLSKGFAYPTPIQAATLPAACLGRRNVVGAAPTGSGKTLAYALPMLNSILTRRDEEDEHENEEDGSDNESGNDTCRVTSRTSEKGKGTRTFLQGLVVCPTRELALQVRSEIRDVCLDTVKSVALVGGLASQKQARVLNGPVRPEIVVATPGRLWELMSSGEHPHLRDFSDLRFVVVDEADRMVLQGSFPQLRDVFTLVAGGGHGRRHRDYRGGGEGVAGDARSRSLVRQNRSGPIDENVDDGTSNNGDAPDDDNIQGSDEGDDADDDDDDDDNEGGSYDGGRLRSLAGVRGEARVTMLDQSILDRLEKQRLEGTIPLPAEVDDEELAELEDDASDGSDAVGDAAFKEPVQRQTFVYSATLTLPGVSTSYRTGPSGRNPTSSSGGRRDMGKKKRRRAETGSGNTGTRITGAIAEILDIVGAQGQTKVVDLTSANAAADMVANDTKSQRRANDAANDSNECNKRENGGPERDGINVRNSRRLPPGLSLYEVKCTQRHKDSHCYAYLTTTRHGSSGPCLIFCNSIAGVRRVGEMLKVLGLPVRTLHAHKAQKSRFKALDTLRKPGTQSRAIVVATDVAARGLDIPSVSTVIHYDVARTIDTFIHRSGRTARGVGEGAVGSSISLVSPGEEMKHRQILEAIFGSCGRRFTPMPIDGRLLSSAQERIALATKIILCDAVQNKATKQNKWFEAAAAEAEMETDEHLVDQGLLGGTCRDRLRLKEAKKARVDLQELLSRPMRKQNFGKFLSSAGLAAAVKAESEVVPHVVQFNENTTKKKHRKRRTRTCGQRPCQVK